MANNIFVYWSAGLGGRHLAIIVGTGGGAFANKNCPQGRAFDEFFSSARGLPGGGILVAGIDSHITNMLRTC